MLLDQEPPQRLCPAGGVEIALGGRHDRPLHQKVPGAGERFGVLEPGRLGEPPDDRADGFEMLDACLSGGMRGAHLQHDVDERARFEILLAKPLVRIGRERS